MTWQAHGTQAHINWWANEECVIQATEQEVKRWVGSLQTANRYCAIGIQDLECYVIERKKEWMKPVKPLVWRTWFRDYETEWHMRNERVNSSSTGYKCWTKISDDMMRIGIQRKHKPHWLTVALQLLATVQQLTVTAIIWPKQLSSSFSLFSHGLVSCFQPLNVNHHLIHFDVWICVLMFVCFVLQMYLCA